MWVPLRRGRWRPLVPNSAGAAIREAAGGLAVPDVRGGAVVLREQERGDCGVCAESAVWARRECADVGAEGGAHLW